MIRGLAVIVPAAFAAAVLARPTWPLDPGVGELEPSANAEVPERALRLGELVQRALWVADDRAWVASLGAAQLPDLLLYWSPTELGDSLGDGAVLLGGVGAGGTRSFELPPTAPGATGASESGWLALYSLGHRSVVASSSVVELAPER